IAANFEDAALHDGAREGSRVAIDREAPPAHGKPGIGTGVALDHQLAAGHAATQPVELGASIADDEPFRLARCHVEYLREPEAPVAAGGLQSSDGGSCISREAFGQEGRHVEALARNAQKREDRPAHAKISRRWNLNWPSFPP